MKKPYNIISLISISVCLAFSVSACSYFDTGEEGEPDTAIMSGHISVPPAGSTLPDNYAQNIARRTKGSVQVFPLTGSTQGMTEAQMPLAPAEENIVVSTRDDIEDMSVSASDGVAMDFVEQETSMPVSSLSTPSVQVFPLPGAMAPAGQPQYQFAGSPQPQAVSQNGVTTIYFGYNAAILDGEARSKIMNIVDMFHSGLMPMLVVEGYASSSSTGTEASHKANFKVSMERASAVARALIAQGVPADKINVKALGDTRPPPYTPGMSADEVGRRVEIRTQ